MPYAVIDFETTGLLPSYHHRVVEVGITHVEDDGSVSGRWETLVNPVRDLGPQRIHGIRGADLLDAPRFEDIVPDVLSLLRDRTLVAHNANFDLRFLVAELTFVGLYPGDAWPHICTLELSHSFGVPGRRTLDSCCAHFGIDLVDAHTAGADSLATAQLLGAYIGVTREMGEWGAYWAQVGRMGTSFPLPALSSLGVAWKPRGETFGSRTSWSGLLSRLWRCRLKGPRCRTWRRWTGAFWIKSSQHLRRESSYRWLNISGVGAGFRGCVESSLF